MRIEITVFLWRCIAWGHAQQPLNIWVHSKKHGNASLFQNKNNGCNCCKSRFPLIAQLVQQSQCRILYSVVGIFKTYLIDKTNTLVKQMGNGSQSKSMLKSNITLRKSYLHADLFEKASELSAGGYTCTGLYPKVMQCKCSTNIFKWVSTNYLPFDKLQDSGPICFRSVWEMYWFLFLFRKQHFLHHLLKRGRRITLFIVFIIYMLLW